MTNQSRETRPNEHSDSSIPQLRFDGLVAIVTGAGRNLGRAYCLDLARRGAAVVVNDIDVEAANAVAEEIRAAGGRAVTCTESVTTASGGRAIVASAADHFGTVDILINNAGNLRGGAFSSMRVEDFDEVLSVHLKGTFCVTQPAWEIMQKRGRGRIIMTGSAAGVYPEEGYSDYATAKAGIVGLTRALAAEGRAVGILVNAILPQAGGSSMTANIDQNASVPNERFAIADQMLRPYKSANAITPLVTYLCSLECRETGLILSAGAGWFGRVFLGLTNGWSGVDLDATEAAETIQRKFHEITEITQFEVPDGASDELWHIARRLDLTAEAS